MDHRLNYSGQSNSSTGPKSLFSVGAFDGRTLEKESFGGQYSDYLSRASAPSEFQQPQHSAAAALSNYNQRYCHFCSIFKLLLLSCLFLISAVKLLSYFSCKAVKLSISDNGYTYKVIKLNFS